MTLFPQVTIHLLVETKTENIFTCGNRVKDFLLLEKTTKYFLLLRKTIVDKFLRKQNQRFSFAWEKMHILFCYVLNEPP